ncbi:hypothetical protein WJX79_010220 [Trebouxia sp. C0005]
MLQLWKKRRITSFGQSTRLAASLSRFLQLHRRPITSSIQMLQCSFIHGWQRSRCDAPTAVEVSEELMELARFFYGYGDTGIIFGMFTRNIGLKFGMQGLTLKCETYKIKLSHDLKAILQFLGLSHDCWRQGFQTQEEMFCFIQSSKYFRPSFFSRQNPEVLELDALKRTNGLGYSM